MSYIISLAIVAVIFGLAFLLGAWCKRELRDMDDDDFLN